jgi:hypothetical protein
MTCSACRDECRERGDHRRIAPSPVHDGAVVGGLAQADCLTSPLNREAALGHHAGLRAFFAIAPFTVAFSRDRPAYSRLGRLFSCSNFFSRFTSNESYPPYLAFHL